MICCTIIAFLFASGLWALRKFRLIPQTTNANPLEWTLDQATEQVQSGEHFDWRARAHSFRYAFNGIKLVFQREHSSWIHLGAAAIAIVFGILLKIDLNAWRWIALCIGLVIASEIINTAIERACDAISTDDNPLIGQAKDMGAGAVLICSISALIIGALTLAPYVGDVGNPFLLDICGGQFD